MIDILWKMYVNYFKIFWLLRPIRDCVGNPWTINCESERNRVDVWESIEGFKTLEQLINDSNMRETSRKYDSSSLLSVQILHSFIIYEVLSCFGTWISYFGI